MNQVDVIIVGAGMAGLCAALEATEQGSRVAIFEKQDTIGGSSLLSGCFMAFAGTNFQERLGIQDSTASLIEDMLTVGQHQNDEALVEAYGKHQLETYNWLVAHGIQFQDCQAVSGHSNPRGHTIIPEQAIYTLRNKAVENGAILYLDSPVNRLIIKEDRVSGVVYEQNGEKKECFANSGVILSTGGFSQSEEMLHLYAPQLDETIRLGGTGNQGDGLKLAASVGAWLIDFPNLKGTYGFHPNSSNERKRQAHTFYKGGIIVNEEGNRFVNESISYKLLGDAALQQKQRTFQVFDQTVMNESVKNDALYDFDLLYSENLIVSADSLEELAHLLRIPTESLVQTVASYNEGIARGKDMYGRKTLTHTFGSPLPIQRAPYYAMETVAAMLATYAGVRVNSRAEVVNPFNEVISGLYAAGEMVGGFHGAGYMTGSSLGKAAIFGRIAAKQAINKLSDRNLASKNC
ncbi:FAD-dependent oxidoreductase [Peribacillus sp. NPDC097675]|uniref:FAD-dependent oxidoreductase n=1 Tax=Peribacillus sp. NPDC097675 TaxID=3390618 RepID=UPI003D0822C4